MKRPAPSKLPLDRRTVRELTATDLRDVVAGAMPDPGTKPTRPWEGR